MAAGSGLPTRVLTIAGTHSGGGAGIEADLRVFTLLGLWGLTAITSVNAQNSFGTQAVHPLPTDLVVAQITAALADGGAAAAKTGQLATGATVLAVAQSLKERPVPWLVVDPVVVSSAGRPLLDATGQQALLRELWPLAALVTPNRPEAVLLLEAASGRPTGGEQQAAESETTASPTAKSRELARRLQALGSGAVLLKGGHGGGRATDLFYDGQGFVEFDAPRIEQPHAGGTGCTLSAAIAGYLALGHGLVAAIDRAKELITAAISGGVDWGQGGRGPCNAFAAFARRG